MDELDSRRRHRHDLLVFSSPVPLLLFRARYRLSTAPSSTPWLIGSHRCVSTPTGRPSSLENPALFLRASLGACKLSTPSARRTTLRSRSKSRQKPLITAHISPYLFVHPERALLGSEILYSRDLFI